jgi:hypothetical protein
MFNGVINHTDPHSYIMDNKKVGIFIEPCVSHFANNTSQVALFIKDLLSSIGFNCIFCTIRSDYKFVPDVHEAVKIIEIGSNINSFAMFIFVSLHIRMDSHKPLIDKFQQQNITCIHLICDDWAWNQQEGRDSANGYTYSRDSWYHEYWLLDRVKETQEFVELVTRKPVHIIPTIWNSRIIDAQMKNKRGSAIIDWNYHEMNRNKINLLILERDKSLIPALLIANQYYLQHTENLNKVFVFCNQDEVENKPLAQALDIFKNKLISFHPTFLLDFPNTVRSIFELNNEHPCVILSFNYHSSAFNFSLLEVLHCNVPFIHNNISLKENGLFYETHNLSTAVNLIENARTSFYITESYRRTADHLKNRFSQVNPFNQKSMTDVMARVCKQFKSSKETVPDFTTHLDKTIVEGVHKLIDSFSTVIAFINRQSTIANMLFYSGTGIVIHVNYESELTLLQCTLESLTKVKNHLRTEVIYSSRSLEKRSISLVVDSVVQNYFHVELLDVCEEGVSEHDTPNSYISCTYSNFEKGILLQPGTILLTDPDELICKYITSKENSFRFCPSYQKLSTLDETDTYIYQSLTKKIDLTNELAVTNPKELINPNGIFFFDKSDNRCLKVLGIMCELFKINTHLCNNVNIIELVCKSVFRNDNSKLKHDAFMYGVLLNKSDFLGYGIGYRSPSEDFEFYMKTLPIALQDAQNRNASNEAMINLNTNNLAIQLQQNKLYTFKGRAKAQKMYALFS